MLHYLDIEINIAAGGLSNVPNKLVGRRTNFEVDPAVSRNYNIVFTVRRSDGGNSLNNLLELIFFISYTHVTYKQCS